jgi:hypothetical protein
MVANGRLAAVAEDALERVDEIPSGEEAAQVVR